ncbi:hypothetical protein PILCRDRAFT_118683 [Piloderma croceum F 1598]|uniref:Uncharacterized protein n=1 Tax=Piloderma croceum (strain F 1598) TaxID=765440 RepID=A0A0C3GP33_PILCF|nr:hypothetical protein PILCRDRAFT_118683 [Piloderma croceum F 1598]
MRQIRDRHPTDYDAVDFFRILYIIPNVFGVDGADVSEPGEANKEKISVAWGHVQIWNFLRCEYCWSTRYTLTLYIFNPTTVSPVIRVYEGTARASTQCIGVVWSTSPYHLISFSYISYH